MEELQAPSENYKKPLLEIIEAIFISIGIQRFDLMDIRTDAPCQILQGKFTLKGI
jgi:hypothetical protein